jgi:hypothetical protein
LQNTQAPPAAFFASIFVVATLSMRTMIPLRVFGILTNVILIASAIPTRNYPTLMLHTVLLPLNTYRLHQMLQLVRDVKKSVNSGGVMLARSRAGGLPI